MKVYIATCEDLTIDHFTHRIEFNDNERKILIKHGVYTYWYKDCDLNNWLSHVSLGSVWNEYIEGTTSLRIKIDPNAYKEFIVELKLRWL